jgi:FhaA, N-terminal domain/FHA domain
MPVLRSIESKLEALFEGIFGRAFRSNVQPVELARKLVKEMDDHRSVSVSRVYVPNEYSVYLAPDDRTQFSGYEPQLCEELQDYLAEHARRERYVLLTPPRVKLETDADLDVGEFGIAVRLVRGPRAQATAPLTQSVGGTAIYKPEAVPAPEPAEDEVEVPVEPGVLVIGEARHELPAHPVVIGRSRDCDVRVSDPNVSRRHAEVRPNGAGYLLVDLGSTNGIEVDGKRVRELALTDGARFTLGSTEIAFSQEPE